MGAVVEVKEVQIGVAMVVTMVPWSGLRVVSSRESALMNCGCSRTCTGDRGNT